MKKSKDSNRSIAAGQQELMTTLQNRFEKNLHRHQEIGWNSVKARLAANPEKLAVLEKMESTGGEPDVVGIDAATGEILFYDCSPESPAGRRSVCYDKEGWESRKEARPENTATEMAAAIGIEILNEKEYRALQTSGTFDARTSSWLKTPADIRKAGGAIFGDFRYGSVFIYHNGAQSYYAARGFRGSLKV